MLCGAFVYWFMWPYIAVAVHGCRMHTLRLKAGLFVSRVPTKENLADDPSREKYDLLERMGVMRCEPRLDAAYVAPQAWAALSLRSWSSVWAM